MISGEGSSEERDNLEAGLLKLVVRATQAGDERQALQVFVEGIETALDVVCIAVGLAPAANTLRALAYSEAHAGYAATLEESALPLAADALVSAAILGANWHVHRDALSVERMELLRLHPEREVFTSAAALPLIATQGTVGALVLFARRETAFTVRHMDALMSAARLLAEDLAERERRRKAEDRQQQLGKLLDELQALATENGEHSVLLRIAQVAHEVGKASFAVIWRLQGNMFIAAARVGDGEQFVRRFVGNADAAMGIGQGPLGQAARDGEFHYVKDVLSDRSFRPWVEVAEASGIRSVLAVPLLRTATATTVLELYAADVDAFGEGVVEWLRLFVPHASEALRHAIEIDELRRATREQALAVTAAAGITRSLDEAEVARSIAHAAADALGALFAITYLADNAAIRVAGSWNAPAELPAALAVNAADPVYSAYPPVQSIQEHRYTMRANVTRDNAWIRMGWEQLARSHGFGSVAALPLLKHGKAIGSVALFYAGEPPVLGAESEVVHQLGVQAGAALDAARSFEQAKSARNFLDRILEQSNDAIVQIDLQGNVVSWNQGAERIFRMSRGDTVGQPFFELPFIPLDRREDIREMLSRVGRGEQVHVFEVECRSNTGSLEVLLSASPARDERGRIVGLVAFSKDISEHKRHAESLQRQNAKLIVMRDVIRSLTREIGLGALSNKGLEKLLEVLRLDTGRLYLYDAADQRLHNVAQRGFSSEASESVSVRPDATGDDGPLSSSISYRQTILIDEAAADRLEQPLLTAHKLADVSAVLTKPLTIGDDVIGALQVVAFEGRRFSVEDQSIFHAVSDELAVALRHARLLEETSRIAITDPLTGLYNYRFTQDFLRKRLSEARRRKRPLSIVMLDVDNVQAINEHYGRDAGDVVLREVGQVLLRSVRLSDVVARYGGDEFIVLLPETQLSDAVILAERMAEAIARHEWRFKDEELNISASLGAASFPEAGSQMQMLLKAADAALYRAKQSGKNAVFPRLDSLPRFAG